MLSERLAVNQDFAETCHSTGSKWAKWNLYSRTWVHFHWSHCESLPRGKGTEKAYRDGTETSKEEIDPKL